MNENMKLRKKLHDLWAGIDGDIDHGECFYDFEMFKEFCERLDELKETALYYYESNREEIKQEELD